jgi:alpha-tubulin suppressor-like RCC1 family protein
MRSNDIGYWCAHVTMAVCLGLTGCSQIDGGADELGDVDRLQSGLVTTPPPVELAPSSMHTCLLSAGNVRCWGRGPGGQLGYGDTIQIGDNEPASTPGFVSVGGTVEQIDTGHFYTCALLDTGGVRCWGASSSGQLGYGNTTTIGDNELPYTAGDVPLSSGAVQIAVGISHSCALLDTGSIQCWGFNSTGQLGYGHSNTIGDDEAPSSQSPVSAGGTVVQLAAGGNHTCALFDTGDVRCWGSYSYGQLGYNPNGHIGDNEAITSGSNVPLGGTAIQIAAGTNHTCALLDTGAVRCWGFGSRGRLGYGNTNNIGDNETPASAGDVPLGGTAVQITAGVNHTCALLDTDAVRCWGEDLSHELGYNGGVSHIGDDETPASAGDVNVGGAVAEVAAGHGYTCVRMQAGGIRCWGSAVWGRLGYGDLNTIGDDETPASAGNVP